MKLEYTAAASPPPPTPPPFCIDPGQKFGLSELLLLCNRPSSLVWCGKKKKKKSSLLKQTSCPFNHFSWQYDLRASTQFALGIRKALNLSGAIKSVSARFSLRMWWWFYTEAHPRTIN